MSDLKAICYKNYMEKPLPFKKIIFSVNASKGQVLITLRRTWNSWEKGGTQ